MRMSDFNYSFLRELSCQLSQLLKHRSFGSFNYLDYNTKKGKILSIYITIFISFISKYTLQVQLFLAFGSIIIRQEKSNR
jgi:hypothetical protein